MYSISTYAIDIDSSTFKDSSIAIRQKKTQEGLHQARIYTKISKTKQRYIPQKKCSSIMLPTFLGGFHPLRAEGVLQMGPERQVLGMNHELYWLVF